MCARGSEGEGTSEETVIIVMFVEVWKGQRIYIPPALLDGNM